MYMNVHVFMYDIHKYVQYNAVHSLPSSVQHGFTYKDHTVSLIEKSEY